MTNHLRFFAITADDVERAKAFYEAVFGWECHAWGPPDFYEIRGAGVSAALQAREQPLAAGPAPFELTISVDDLDDIARRVASAGGRVFMQKSHIETVGTLIRFTDTEGNPVGAMKYDSPEVRS